MTGAGGIAVVQAASVLASSSPQTAQLSLVPPVDRLGPLETFSLRELNLLEGSRMLGIILRLVPLVQHPHPGQGRHGVCQHPHGQASGGRRERR